MMTTRNRTRTKSDQARITTAELTHAEEMISRSLSEEQVDRLRALTGYNPRKRICPARRLLIEVTLAYLSGDTLGFQALRSIFVSRLEDIEPAAFQNRLKDPNAPEFFRVALNSFTQSIADSAGLSLKGSLACYEDVRVYDATCERVPPRGRQAMPACADGKAGAKLLVGYSLKTGLADEALCEAQTAAELPMWRRLVPELKESVLYLFDLAYFHKSMYTKAQEVGADVLMRLKAKSRVKVIGVATENGYHALPGWSKEHFLNTVSRRRGTTYDLDVIWGELKLRLVGYAQRYDKVRWYLTTAPRDKLTADEVVKAYRLRWLIELLFREIKQSADLGRCFTANENAIKALSYGALLAHALVRSIRIAASLAIEVPLEELRPLACLHMVRACADAIADTLIQSTPEAWKRLFAKLSKCIGFFAREKHPSRSRPRIALDLGATGG